MGTVNKAISLLEILGRDRPELALTDLARRAGFDKATTRRLLVSLATHGLVEQDPASRLYRLGAGLSRLALMREAQFPFLRVAGPVADMLARETDETVHVSEHTGGGLVTVHVVESTRANRVAVALGGTLPLHATASGLAFLAFAERRTVQAALAGPLKAFTPHTVTDPARVEELLAAARARGYSIGAQGFEDAVISVAAPIPGPRGLAIGTIAIAAPSIRVHRRDIEAHGAAAMRAAGEIAARLTGRPQSEQLLAG